MPPANNNATPSILNQWNFKGMTPAQRRGGIASLAGDCFVIGSIAHESGVSGLIGFLPAIGAAIGSDTLFYSGYYSLGSAFASAATFMLRASSATSGNDPLKGILAVQAVIVGAGAFLYPMQCAAMATATRWSRLSKFFKNTAGILPTTIGATNALVIRPFLIIVSGNGESWGILTAQAFFMSADLLKGNITEHLKAIRKGCRATVHSAKASLPKSIFGKKNSSGANDNEKSAAARPGAIPVVGTKAQQGGPG